MRRQHVPSEVNALHYEHGQCHGRQRQKHQDSTRLGETEHADADERQDDAADATLRREVCEVELQLRPAWMPFEAGMAGRVMVRLEGDRSEIR
jgi:hypothetical protein